MTPSPQQPIGIFDSGVGGLSIAAALHTLLPLEALVYFGDRANFPYGSRSEDEVRALACAATERLLAEGAKLIVVACNTASSGALATLRTRYDVPFVGVVPGVKPATASTQNRKVAVLATDGTFQTRVFDELVQQFAEGVEVHRQVCPDLVALVEHGEVATDHTVALLRRYVEPLVAAGYDTLVLGCTHYAFLRAGIQQVAGPGITVIDTAPAIAQQVQRVLSAASLLNPGPAAGTVRILTSGQREAYMAVAAALWPEGAQPAVASA